MVAQSGDITSLDWVGQSSEFNSCLPADITSYKALPACTLPPTSEDGMRTLVLPLRSVATLDLTCKLYTMLDNLSAPRLANSRLHLPCIAFRITEVRLTRGQEQDTRLTHEVKANGLHDLQITTEDKLVQFSAARPSGIIMTLGCLTLQTILRVRARRFGMITGLCQRIQSPSLLESTRSLSWGHCS